jgi:AAA+ superfamily predicted ATPase
VLLGIDSVAASLPNVLFVVTTNFLDAVDEAFLSRADLIMHFSLPDADTVVQILRHSLEELAVQWPAVRPLLDQGDRLAEVGVLCKGWDGRRIRKLVLAALAQRNDVARDPGLLTMDDLVAAARKEGGVERVG